MQDTGLKRNTKDQYFTKKEVVDTCLQHWYEKIAPKQDELIIEPSAGNGAFSNKIMDTHISFQAFDIDPKSKEITKIDFLQLDIDIFPHIKIHFIGNPPFGRQSSLAKKFIKHICKSTKTATLSFILPRSFKKESMQKAFPLQFHLISQIDIPNDSFLINGENYSVPCVFQIWKRQDIDRKISPILKPKGYIFVKDKMHATFALRRVGVYAGKIIDMLQDGIDFENLSDQSHYYIQITKKMSFKKRDLLKEKYYDTITWNHNNTVGPKSIGKQEFIKQLNTLF